MKLKTPILRSVVIISIILLSVIVGVVYDTVWNGIDKNNYPREFDSFVELYAEKYGVPEYVIYGVIKYECGFDAGKTAPDGGAGLMGLNGEEFDFVLRLAKDSLDSDSRYGPETSIKYGALYLAHLHAQFGSWEAVYAAKCASLETWQSWYNDDGLRDETGAFSAMPEGDWTEPAKKMKASVQKYRDMYYE